jgi:hypothetical protein
MANCNPSPAFWEEPDKDKYVVVVRVQLNRDGCLSPRRKLSARDLVRFIKSLRRAARRAVELSQPFEMLSPSTYDAWKDEEINFDPALWAPHPLAETARRPRNATRLGPPRGARRGRTRNSAKPSLTSAQPQLIDERST